MDIGSKSVPRGFFMSCHMLYRQRYPKLSVESKTDTTNAFDPQNKHHGKEDATKVGCMKIKQDCTSVY